MELSRLFISAILTIIITIPVIINLHRNGKLGHHVTNIVNHAKQTGCIIIATKIREYDDTQTSDRRDRRHSVSTIYEYYVNGRRYKKHYLSSNFLPDTITLYYRSTKPHQAYQEGEPDQSPKMVLAAILPVILWSLIYNIWNMIAPT